MEGGVDLGRWIRGGGFVSVMDLGCNGPRRCGWAFSIFLLSDGGKINSLFDSESNPRP